MTKPTDHQQFDLSGEEPLANFSGNPEFSEVMASRLNRRKFLQGSVALAVSGFLGQGLLGCSSQASSTAMMKKPAGLLGFDAITINRFDSITVPAGYRTQVFLPWGTPLTADAPDYRADASHTADEQAKQVGMHHDGMHFFPIDVKQGGQSSNEGLLVMNHEYVDPNVLHPFGGKGLPRVAEEVHKELAAHGVSVAHIKKQSNGEWQLVRDSHLNRRITGSTPMELTGPVRGHDKVVTRYSPDGTRTRGTLNNCSHGVTPWGTYLTCEENWALLFVNHDQNMPREHRRYSIADEHSILHWETAGRSDDQISRFNATPAGTAAVEDYRNEPNNFGWIVEIDPFNPDHTPVKHTAMGRFAHEGIIFAKAEAGKPLVAYSGDDARFEYIYKFVSAGLYDPATAGPHLLDEGTLYVARFNDDGSGEWLPLDFHNDAFQAKAQAAGVVFSDQADVLINTRLAADLLGATKMDRPEWGAVHPETNEVYFTLTNNSRRHTTDAANPRANNHSGHIIRWREADQHAFNWDIFLLSGDAYTYTPHHNAMLSEQNHHASPDGLWFDPNGLLWIQTDMSGSQMRSGPFGNNQMLVADVSNHNIKRFLVGPVDCEVTGVVMTPDCKTMFVNIQHPGEGSGPFSFSSTWPDRGTKRPRSATVVITKDDGGIIGS
ncbi:PhoX family phosphatase [Alkalimonas collagenimarina]|uniref:PhoX family phosphatase n=1 Tax=Alkalimonas collagenimarina TaxID=400390 RepID=A0ABT9H3J1_9GAMM|nr:PhoX family phosphatase [Alkalimonas collagenimarina]MDP4537888.1 PhoX family phosphatase [Alkalimonas collagenimarina]